MYALITGASSGIGKSLAYEFAKANINLVLIARTSEALQAISADIEKTYNVKCLFMAVDLVHHTIPYEIYQKCLEAGLQIEYLVNNAGFGDYGPFVTSSSQKELAMIDLNIRSLTIMTKLFLTDMLARGSGKIMNLASTAAFQAGPLMAVYFATKAYVLSFSEAIAEELAGTGVTVTALCPGPTSTGFTAAADAEGNKLFSGKLPSSEEVAKYGFKAMMAGTRVAIHGSMNKFLVFLTRITPRSILSKIIKKMQS